MTRLSHSAANKYQTCPKSYEFHYIKRYRSLTQSSALLFGNILDKAFEVYLKTQDEGAAREALYQGWKEQEINGKLTQLQTCTQIVYANADYDEELLSEDVIAHLQRDYGKDVLEQVSAIYKQKEAIGFQMLSKEKKKLLNEANWYCMMAKGYLMLTEAIRVANSQIEEVYGTQLKVSLKNDNEDEITGFIDFVAKMKGYEEPVIMDLKTAARPYERDAVQESQQLCIYTHAVSNEFRGTRKAGYLVILKNMFKTRNKICSVCGHDGTGKTHKTCPAETGEGRCNGAWNEKLEIKAGSQLIIDDVPETYENVVVENMDEINKAIKAGIFPRNFSACENYGGCEFKDVCLKGKSCRDAGLMVKED